MVIRSLGHLIYGSVEIIGSFALGRRDEARAWDGLPGHGGEEIAYLCICQYR